MTIDAGILGTGWGFPPAFDPRSKQAVLVSAAEDIEQSLRILLTTVPGERIMQPSYGCDLKHLVFENIDQNRITEIKDLIAKAVLFFEVRIDLHETDVDASELFVAGLLRLRLAYTIRTTNTRHNLVFPLYLREASAVGHVA
jgi:phage baseplate assembly protein W